MSFSLSCTFFKVRIFFHLFPLCLALLVSGFVSASDDPNIDPEMVEMNAAKKVRLSGSELLPHNIPGETFRGITGEVGHSAVDMTLSDNGPLSFSVRRTFKEQPGVYPYAFSNHSLTVPYIEFETNLGITGFTRESNPCVSTCS